MSMDCLANQELVEERIRIFDLFPQFDNIILDLVSIFKVILFDNMH